MLLRFFSNLVGKTFGTGVTYSCFHLAGQIPCLIEELIISVRGTLNCSANCLIMFGGISPSGTDFLGLISFNFFSTSNSLNWGIVFLSKEGISIALVFRAVNFCLTAQK